MYLISGGGSGIGRAVARNLAGAGNRVLLVGRTAEKLEATRAELPEPAAHRVLACDVRDAAGLAAGLEAAGLEEGLAGVISAAGVGGANHYGPDDRWDEVLEINLTGAYRTVHEALPYLRRRDGYRSVVFISSVLARLGVPGYSAYCAAKAGLLGLTRSLAAELAPEKILVNAINPGWVDTAMATEGLEGFAKAAGCDLDEARRRQLAVVPLGKMSTPEEIAATVAFLVDGRQTSLTGEAIDINNGAVMTP